MKPAPFEYYDPVSKEEVFKLLDKFDDDAKLLAGGQSLIPMMNFRLAKPKVLIDINKLNELDFIREENGCICIGALTRECSIEKSELIKSKIPILSEAVKYIAHLPIRNKGTLGGSIAHADPSAELCLMMIALDAQIKIESSQDARWVNAEEFFMTYLTTVVQPHELITEIKIPIPPVKTIHSFQTLSRRAGDFAIVSAAVMIEFDKDGKCKNAKIALGSVSPTPFRATEAENMLIGKKLDEKLITSVAETAAEGSDPDTDLQSSEDYKREMANIFTKKGLMQVFERFQENA